jgi:hypothetical protein
MLSLTEIFTILIIHWIADFVLQTDKQAKGKSKNWKDLLSHTFNYSLIFWCFAMIVFKANVFTSFYFWLITFICHTITDYFTSRLNTKLLPPIKSVFLENNTTEMLAYPKNSSWHNFFIGVGYDQILHYIQLFLTYYYLKNSI